MLKLPVTFDNFSPRADKSVGLRFTSAMEVPAEYYKELANNVQMSGWLQFDEKPIQEAPKEDLPDMEKKPSKRLRNVLFIKHQQNGGTEKDFEPYYIEQINKIIEKIKSLLD